MLKKGEHYALPLLRKRMIYKRYVIKVWYLNHLGKPTLDYISRLKIKNMTIRATVHSIHPTYVEFMLENNKIITLKTEQALKLEKFL